MSTSITPVSSSIPVSISITPLSSTTVAISSLLSTVVLSSHNPRPMTSNILPSSLAVMCETDGQWMETLAGSNATNVGFCYRGTVDGEFKLITLNILYKNAFYSATRKCDLNGIWNKFYCLISPEFNTILNQVSHITDLINQLKILLSTVSIIIILILCIYRYMSLQRKVLTRYLMSLLNNHWTVSHQ